MISGRVSNHRAAVVRLRVRGPAGTEVTVRAVVDTGFTSSLTLPPQTVAALGLEPRSVGQAVLADGEMVQYDLCPAEVEWDGVWRPVVVSVLGSETLLGMSLLLGHELRVEVKPGGVVEIAPLA